MYLADSALVLTTMGVGSNAGSLDNAKRALDLSLPIIENLLETKFDQVTTVDYFSPDGKLLQFRLSNIFVDSGSLKVRRATGSDPLFLPTDGELVPSSEYFLNPDNGVLTFRQAPAKGQHSISVQYDSGLGEGDVTEVFEAPQWLRETAISMAVLVLNTHPSTPANRKEKTVANVSDTLYTLATMLLSSKRRMRMCLGMPVRTMEL